MNEVKWNDRFNIGVEGIDKAHRRLFSIVSKLISLNEDETKQQHACREGIKYFKNYTTKHFAEEEAYMKSIGYADYDIHKSLHDNMRDKTLPALEQELEEQDYSVKSVQHFLGICVGWLNGHIMIEDHAITGKTTKKWVHQGSENEMASLEKAISQALDKLFRVKAQVISEHYSGEDFSSGKALCYRLTYTCADAKRPLLVYLIYGENMILSMLSETLDQPVKKSRQNGYQRCKNNLTEIYGLPVLPFCPAHPASASEGGYADLCTGGASLCHGKAISSLQPAVQHGEEGLLCFLCKKLISFDI